MTAPTASRPPAGMPPHLWELAKRDVRGAVPDRVRHAADASATAPRSVRAIARRAAVAGGTLGAAAAAAAFAAGPAVADSPVDLASFDGAVPPSGATLPGGLTDGTPEDGGGASGGPAGDGGGGYGGYASTGVEGSLADGPVSSDLGSTFRVQEGPPGAETTLTVSIFQDVTVVESADGMFQVDAYQFIVITDSDGNEYVFREHYQVVVPDPPGQETDLIVHETGRVHIVENPDGSFTPVSVDYGIEVYVGSDGDGRDEIGVRQDESVRITESGEPDADDTTVRLDERARTDSQDLGDEAFTEIDQITRGPGAGGGGGGSTPHPWSEHPGPGFDELPSGPTGGTTGTSPTTGTTGTTGIPAPSTTGTGSGTTSTGSGTAGTTTTAPAATTATTAGTAGTAGIAAVGVEAVTVPTAAGQGTAAPLDSSLAPEPAMPVTWSGADDTVPADPAPGTEPTSTPDDVFGGRPATAPEATRPETSDDTDARGDGADRDDPSGSSDAGGTDNEGAGQRDAGLEDSGFADAGHEDAGDGGGQDGGSDGQGSGGSDGQADSALVG